MTDLPVGGDHGLELRLTRLSKNISGNANWLAAWDRAAPVLAQVIKAAGMPAAAGELEPDLIADDKPTHGRPPKPSLNPCRARQ